MAVIPANPGFAVVVASKDEDGWLWQTYAIIGWLVVDRKVSPLTIAELAECGDEERAILRPDGKIEADADMFENVEHWLDGTLGLSGGAGALGEACVKRSSERSKILERLNEADAAMSPIQIAAETGLRRENVRFLLGKMVADGEALKGERGKYASPEHPDFVAPKSLVY